MTVSIGDKSAARHATVYFDGNMSVSLMVFKT